MSGLASQCYEGIVTCDDDDKNILRTPTCFLEEKNWNLAQNTIQKLRTIRNDILKGGAGLAAPQIGVSLPIFIYTPSRNKEDLIDVINPSFEPMGTEMVEGAEACFSSPLRCVKLRRWKTIKCHYQDLAKKWHDVILKDFAAKVFQHEMDHLQGKLTLDHPYAEITTFSERGTFDDHVKKVHLEDSKTYKSSGWW